MNKYNVKIITAIDQNFINQWAALWKTSVRPTVFNSYEWFKAMNQSYNIKKYEFFTCYNGEELVAIIPLCYQKSFGIQMLGFLGSHFVVDTGFLFKEYDTALFKYLFGELIKERSIYLTKLDTKSVEILKELFPQLFFSLISVNPFISFDKDPKRFFSKNLRHDIGKIQKHYSQQLILKNYEKNDLEKAIEIIFDIAQNSSKHTKSMDIFSDEENKRIFKNLITYCRDFIKVYILYFDKIPLVYSFCFIYNKTFIGYQTSYLHSHRHLSPGKYIISSVIDDLNKNTVEIFDFGGGLSSFKQQFTKQYFFQYNLYYSPNIIIMIWFKMINYMRRMKQVIKPLAFTRDHEFLFKIFPSGLKEQIEV